MEDIGQIIDDMIADPRHGWSIGTFGAVGEFVRDADEPAAIARDGDARIVSTSRAAMRLVPHNVLKVVAYDTLSRDGETWGHSVAFCLPAPAAMAQGKVRALGPDQEALRPEDRDAHLFDIGAGLGHVRFCVRTHDAGLIEALVAMDGWPLFSEAGRGVMAEVLRAQPVRVLVSPVGRVEVYSAIPPPDGKSPEGPHTHLMPKLVASGRTHAANSPIPEGMQPVLMLHPGSPWRDSLGNRIPFDAELDDIFEDLFVQFGLPEDLAIRAAVEDAVDDDVAPDAFPWPATRRGRAEARITLRRLARIDSGKVEPWRQRYDRAADQEPDETELVQA